MAKARAKAKSGIYQLKISLANIRPPIWRRIQTANCNLERLHQIIQSAMGWESYHLWAFDIGDEQYGPADDNFPMDEMRDGRSVQLSDLEKAGVAKFRYTYDFGDSWEHIITIEKVVAADPEARYPRCIKGKRACPPEDCGGAWGYGNFLEALEDPDHAEHEDMLEWSGGDFDPEEFDLNRINARLSTGF